MIVFGNLVRHVQRAQLGTRLFALWLLVRHPDTPRAAKWLAFAVLAYAVSPIDLIPDFIPVLGLLDDVVLVPLGIALVTRLVPPALWAARLAEAQRSVAKLPRLRWGLFIVVGLWVLLIALAWLGLAASAHAAPKVPAEPTELSGRVARIVDGDTLWLRTAVEGEPTVIRIEGIDAPESCQPGGAEATQALTRLAFDRTVSVRVVARDEHGRTVGKVFDGSKDIGDRMVRDGFAWSARYRYDRGPYVAEERMAQSLKRGLHADAGALMPRDFRQRHGPCQAGVGSPSLPLPAAVPPPAGTQAAGRCDGRQYCSQMTSCAEARWFLANCPGVKMDGNRDGVPCEQQWCRSR
jgi:endonuclease YncB( thermonuclease family)